MKILFRTDASASIGLGHAMRCLALAQAARDAGHSAIFASAVLPPALEKRLQDEGCDVFLVLSAPGSAEDSAETAKLAHTHSVQWIVTDGYHFSPAYQAAIRKSGVLLLFLDDYGHGTPYAANLILNQNSYAPQHPEWYEDRPPDAHVLLGSPYTLLRREFRSRVPEPKLPAIASSVLVTLGGGDPKNGTLAVMEALEKIEGVSPEVTVVIGGANPHVKKIQAAPGNMRIVVNPPDMPSLMAGTDLAIAAAGTTSYELAYMGVPALLTILAENQRHVAEDLAERGVSGLFGDPAEMPSAEMAQHVTELLMNREKRMDFSKRGRALVDGLGTKRVLAAMSDFLPSL